LVFTIPAVLYVDNFGRKPIVSLLAVLRVHCGPSRLTRP
jgi:hypothetical protein